MLNFQFRFNYRDNTKCRMNKINLFCCCISHFGSCLKLKKNKCRERTPVRSGYWNSEWNIHIQDRSNR